MKRRFVKIKWRFRAAKRRFILPLWQGLFFFMLSEERNT